MLNYRFPSASEFTEVLTTGRADIGENIHIALDPDRGIIKLEPEESFRLIFEPSSPAPRWVELGIALPDKGWLECRSIHVKYMACAQKPARVRVALRLHRSDGFYDHFSGLDNEVHGIPEHVSADFVMSAQLLEHAQKCDLHLFFESTANVFDLHDLVVTGLR